MKSGLLIRVQSREVHGFPLPKMVKELLFLDTDVCEYDGLITQCIARAIDDLERFTGWAIGVQVRKFSFSVLTESTQLPYGPYLETVNVSDGGEVSEEGLLTASWPTGGSVTVKCGLNAETILDRAPSLLACVALAAAEYTGLNPSLKAGGWKESARRQRTFTWAS